MRAEVYLTGPAAHEAFDKIFGAREQIEDAFGGMLEWVKNEQTAKFGFTKEGVPPEGVYEGDTQPEVRDAQYQWLADHLSRLLVAAKPISLNWDKLPEPEANSEREDD